MSKAKAKPAGVVEGSGYRCKACGCPHLPVLWVRHRAGKTVRKRECRNCGKQVTTYEEPAKGDEVTPV